MLAPKCGFYSYFDTPARPALPGICGLRFRFTMAEPKARANRGRPSAASGDPAPVRRRKALLLADLIDLFEFLE
jgi:hypothetical protein